MRLRHTILVAALALVASACHKKDTTEPSSYDEGLSLVPEFVQSMATSVDAGGIGGAMLPDNLALTTEQKAAIAALHDAFRAATAADVAALQALEAEARAAKLAGKSREEIHAILERGAPIVARLTAAFAVLQGAIWQVYTPEQRAWIEAHRPRPCGPGGPPKLTDVQIQQIRELQQAFMASVKDLVAQIEHVVQLARQAAQAGASRSEVEQILHQADAARAQLQEAEHRLQDAIDAILTPEQRANRCEAPKPPGRP
jgi:Spy/CpxP family protein refolding chaperone